MRTISIVTFLCLTLLSCNTTTGKQIKPIAEPKKDTAIYAETQRQSESKITGPKFFDYDAIDYYTLALDDQDVSKISRNQSKSETDSFKMGIIRGAIPKNISDLAFIEQLEKIGYKKTNIDPSKFESIDQIFVKKTATNHEVYACIHVYRDILIFKKSNKVVGTAKICFHCMGQQIKGPKTNSRNFLQNEDFDRLEILLKQ